MTWTHYGRWTDDGLRVLNDQGREIYSLVRLATKPRIVKELAVVPVSYTDSDLASFIPTLDDAVTLEILRS